MLLKTLIRKINKIITQSCQYYEAKTQHHMQHQKHTQRQNGGTRKQKTIQTNKITQKQKTNRIQHKTLL
jgi:hypothetical protein